MQGGAIDPKKVRFKEKKKDEKVDQALQKKMQGGTYFDPIHKHLHKNLSGRGGRFDPPYVRKKMHELMSGYHPSVFQSYMKGKYHDLPQDKQYHPGKPIRKTRPDTVAHVINTGGSLSAITHSENGLLHSFDSTFYHHLELV